MDEIKLGWLNPQGDFFPSEFGNHVQWAYDFIDNNNLEDVFLEYKSKDKETRDANDFMINYLGWVLIHDPSYDNISVQYSLLKLSKRQKSFLFNHLLDYDKEMALSFIKEN